MSLVEIVIALGIVAFALIAIFGLLSVSTQSSLEAQRDTAIALAARELVGKLRVNENYAATSVLTSNAFFTQDGTLQPAATAESAFDCQLTVHPRPGNPHLADVSMTFRWPAGSTSPHHAQTIQASLANF